LYSDLYLYFIKTTYKLKYLIKKRMSDKIEYSRLLLKRTGQTGQVPTIPTGVTLNEMIPTDLFVGEMYCNVADDALWIRTDNGIYPISLSGLTATTPDLGQVLYEGNFTNGYDSQCG
jgi:hypothetical protein